MTPAASAMIEQFRQAAPEDRAAVMEAVLEEWRLERQKALHLVPGVFPPSGGNPLVLTPEETARLQKILDHLDDQKTYSHEEMMEYVFSDTAKVGGTLNDVKH